MGETSEPLERLRETYARLDAEVAVYQPRCDASGRCCRFEEYGHTLFLSELEAELLFEPGIPLDLPITRANCPYQVERFCTARERRPMGCRVYFCDPAFAEKQVELSEKYIRELKDLHVNLGRPWRYAPLHDFAATAPRTELSRTVAGESPAPLLELT
ncbi:MAG: hypothetical protein U1D30_07830 [Planctomycetota bacterium]